MISEFKLLQCNIQSLSKHKDELNRILITDNYSAAFVSETWTNQTFEHTSKYNIYRYHKFLHSRNDHYGGSAIFLHQDFSYSNINLPSVSELTQVIAIRVVSLDIVLVSIYIAPSITKPNLIADLKNIFSALRSHKKVILGGDFNAHHQEWGNDNNDAKGQIVMNLINEFNVILLNKKEKTYIPVQLNKTSTAIDLTLCSPTIFGDCEWKTLDYGIGSHHLLIQIIYSFNSVEKTQYVYNYKKIKTELQQIDLPNNTSIEHFQNIVSDIHKKNRFKNKHTPKYWWNEEINRAWIEKREARANFNRQSSVENLILYKKKEAIFNKLKNQATKENLKNFVSDINPSMSSSELWLKIGKLTGKKRKQRTNNILYEDAKLAEQFLDKHFGKNDITGNFNSNIITDYDLLTLEKFNNILSKKKKRSTPGEDKITYEMLSILKPETKLVVIKMLNDFWRNCFLPNVLKTIKVIAIPKPGKDQSTVEGKRPISLVPTLTKVMNSAVLEKFINFTEDNNIIPDTSFGFRKNNSTITCTNFVVNMIKKNKRENKLTAIVFIDLSNAFNSVKTDILIDIMNEFNFPCEITAWIAEFLKNRKITFESNNQSIVRISSNGLPQGDVLSPPCYNVYTANLHKIADDNVSLVQYADDFCLIVSDKTLESLNHRTQIALNKLTEKLQELNFSINPDKTKAILFQNSNNTLSLQINNKAIETVKYYTYLGITLDRFMSFGIHMKNTKSKIIERLNMIKVINSIKYGAHPQTMILVYKSIFRSVIEYGASVFNNAKKTNKQILNTINNQCLRKITGCTKTTPLNSLNAIASSQPLDKRHHYITCKEIARSFNNQNIISKQLLSLNSNIDNSKLSYLEKVYLEEKNVFTKIAPTVKFTLNQKSLDIKTKLGDIDTTKKNTNPFVIKSSFLFLQNNTYKNRPSIYTDASKEERLVGIGVYNAHNNRRYSFKLLNETCITTAELIAINTALNLIDEDELANAVIYTDSKSSCLIIQSSLNYKKVPTLIQEIIKKASKWNTTIQWIPSHTNISGNELADKLAKQGLNSSTTLSNDILIKDAFNTFKINLMEKTNLWYREYAEEKGKTFYQFQPIIEKESWFFNKNLTNEQTRLLNRLLVGHDYSKYWKAKMKLVDEENCDLCDEPETAEHIILHCCKFGHTRTKYSFDCRFRNLLDLFKTKDLNLYVEVFDFLKEIKADI